VKPVGSFEDWSVIIRGILERASIQGFLANSDQLYEQADIDTMQWEAFLKTLDDEHRTRDYPYRSRGAVIRKALDEYLRRANKSPTPAATAKATAITAKAPAPQDWR
jgi:hypothetical protein